MDPAGTTESQKNKNHNVKKKKKKKSLKIATHLMISLFDKIIIH